MYPPRKGNKQGYLSFIMTIVSYKTLFQRSLFHTVILYNFENNFC